MTSIGVVLFIMLILSLSLNGFQFVWYYEVQCALDDAFVEIQAKDAIISECKDGYSQLNKQYAEELQYLRKMIQVSRESELKRLKQEIERLQHASISVSAVIENEKHDR